MSDRPPRPAANRRATPAGAAPPKPETATPAGEPEAAAPTPPEPSVPADKPDMAAPGRTEPSAPVEGPGMAASPAEPPRELTNEPPRAAAQDYPELSASSGEPAGTARFDETRAPPGATIPPAVPPRGPGYRGLALGLAATLLLVLALLATMPFWAPLLPWGGALAGPDPAVVKRLDAGQQQIRSLEQQTNAATAAMPRLEQRIAALEQKPPPSPPDLGEMRQRIAAVSSGLSELTPRLERLENSVQAQTGALSEVKAGLEQLDKTTQAQAANLSDFKTDLDKLGQTQQAQAADLSDVKTRLEQVGQAQQAQQQTQANDLAAKLNPLQQGLQAQQAAVAALGNRLQNFEKTAQSRTGDLTDMGLTLALMQIRNAVETGQPFAAQYNALSSLAKNRPEIAAAAAPLADAARTGTADRAELARELSALAQRIEAAPAASGADGSWAGAALDRLSSLVRIRRADEAAPGKEAAAAITVAERALAGGDLPRAVAAIETLQGPAATAAADWLRQARERLAVESALHRLEGLLTARLGDTTALPGAPG